MAETLISVGCAPAKKAPSLVNNTRNT